MRTLNQNRRPATRWGVSLALISVITLQTACGTLLFPERRGQDRGPVDPGVVLMDGLLLLFGIIPGVVAFAVDFSTGAIYLSSAHSLGADHAPGEDEVTVVRLDPNEITAERLAQVIREHTGQEVTLTEADLRTFRSNNRSNIAERVTQLHDRETQRQSVNARLARSTPTDHR